MINQLTFWSYDLENNKVSNKYMVLDRSMTKFLRFHTTRISYRSWNQSHHSVCAS